MPLISIGISKDWSGGNTESCAEETICEYWLKISIKEANMFSCEIMTWKGDGVWTQSWCSWYVWLWMVVLFYVNLRWKKKKPGESEHKGCSLQSTMGGVCSVTAAINIGPNVTKVRASGITNKHPTLPIHGYPMIILCPKNLVTFKRMS